MTAFLKICKTTFACISSLKSPHTVSSCDTLCMLTQTSMSHAETVVSSCSLNDAVFPLSTFSHSFLWNQSCQNIPQLGKKMSNMPIESIQKKKRDPSVQGYLGLELRAVEL